MFTVSMRAEGSKSPIRIKNQKLGSNQNRDHLMKSIFQTTSFQSQTKSNRDDNNQARKRSARGRLLGDAVVLAVAVRIIRRGDSGSSYILTLTLLWRFRFIIYLQHTNSSGDSGSSHILNTPLIWRFRFIRDHSDN